MARSRQVLEPPSSPRPIRGPGEAKRPSRSDAALTGEADELRRLNWALAACARSSAALMHAASFEELVASVCRAIVGDDDYLLAAAGLVEEPPGAEVRMIAGAGSALGYLDELRLSGSETTAEGQGPTGRAIRTGQPSLMRDVREEPDLAPWRRRALAHGIRSSVTVPFSREGRVVGILKVYSGKPDAFGERELRVFVQLAGELAFALGILEERVRRQDAEEARRDAEDRARESLAELARAARVVSLGAFAASLAHEVNQPIAAIMANGEAALRWLDKSPPNLAEVRAALVRITRDAERTAAVVGRTRGMLAKNLGEQQAVDAGRLVEETLQFTQPQQRRCQVRAEIAVAQDLPPVWADPVQIQQVLVNLVTNAIDAMKSVTGRRRVLRAAVDLSADGQVMFSISDTGTGIGEAFAGQVFEHLFTTKPDGIGLGLPICRSIVEAHGGRIAMRSNAPFGTVFSFTLPPAPSGTVPV